MKTLATFGIAALLATAAIAEKNPAAPAGKKAEGPKMLACPVMKDNKVNVDVATMKKMYADHEGKRYFFCCPGCPAEFKKNPAKYAKGAHIVLPKAKKAKG